MTDCDGGGAEAQQDSWGLRLKMEENPNITASHHIFGPHLRPNVHIRSWVGLKMWPNAQISKPNATHNGFASPPKLNSDCITLLNAQSQQNVHSRLELIIIWSEKIFDTNYYLKLNNNVEVAFQITIL